MAPAKRAKVASDPRTRPLQLESPKARRPPAVFTAGYSGHTPASFAVLLRGAGVKQVLDVRSFPHSRKPGFSKAPLEAFLQREKLHYVHLPALGAPHALLSQKKGGATMAEIAPAYARHLAGQSPAFEEAVGLATTKPSVLLCLEKDPNECHRGILAKSFAKKGFRVVHL